jgi:hypothetical protein
MRAAQRLILLSFTIVQTRPLMSPISARGTTPVPTPADRTHEDERKACGVDDYRLTAGVCGGISASLGGEFVEPVLLHLGDGAGFLLADVRFLMSPFNQHRPLQVWAGSVSGVPFGFSFQSSSVR